MKVFGQYIKDLEELSGKQNKPQAEEIGYVDEAHDGVALKPSGTTNVSYGEIVTFASGVKGTVIDILPEIVGIVLF